MPLNISQSEIIEIGNLLRSNLLDSSPRHAALYKNFISHCERERGFLVSRINDEIGPEVEAIGRTKTTGTLRSKLLTNPKYLLTNIRDVVGARLTLDCTLDEQDEMARRLTSIFEGKVTPIDRRTKPMCGYRALHLEVRLDGIRGEIQIRTDIQAQWANAYEELADRWGRQIRYGEPPNGINAMHIAARSELIEMLIALSLHDFAYLEENHNELRRRLGSNLEANSDQFEEYLRVTRGQAQESLERLKIMTWEAE